MSETTYDKNQAAADTVQFQQRLAQAMTNAATAIMSEDPATLSPPTGFRSDVADSDERKRLLHVARAELCNKCMSGAYEQANRFRYNAARYMNVYIDGTSGDVFMTADSQEAVDADYDGCCSALWNNWATQSH